LPHYPTKHQPNAFFADATVESTMAKFQSSKIVLVEDSKQNLHLIQQAFPDNVHRTYHVHSNQEKEDNSTTLSNVLLYEYGLLDPTYAFSQVDYLRAKNKVDLASIHVDTWNHVVQRMLQQPLLNDKLWIVDVGAGLLLMLDLLLHGNTERGMMPLKIGSYTNDNTVARAPSIAVRYTAYESNRDLGQQCHTQLLSWGFERIERVSTTEILYRHTNKQWEVQLLLRDFADPFPPEVAKDMSSSFSSPRQPNHAPNLIIGCCFADLIDPTILTIDLIRTFGLLHKMPATGATTLLYFPITFAGVTQFLPSRPFQSTNDETNSVIPSDTVAFRSYSQTLSSVLGHNLDPHALVQAMENHGVSLAAMKPSSWWIDPLEDEYLYDTMLYFFGRTAGPQLLQHGYDACGWIHRARTNRPVIHVTNRDLLFYIGSQGFSNAFWGNPRISPLEDKSSLSEYKEIQFTQKHHVEVVNKPLPNTLRPRQVLSKSDRPFLLATLAKILVPHEVIDTVPVYKSSVFLFLD
jgi:hypothetical protein